MPNSSARSKHGRRSRRRGREDPAKNELVSSSLESARQCLLNQDYGTAFVHYLLVLNLAPLFKELAKVIRVNAAVKTPTCTFPVSHNHACCIFFHCFIKMIWCLFFYDVFLSGVLQVHSVQMD